MNSSAAGRRSPSASGAGVRGSPDAGDQVEESSEPDAGSVAEVWRDRLTFVFSLAALAAFTAVVILYSQRLGTSELTGLALVWVALGYAAFLGGTHGFASARGGPRPHLTVGRGVPAWAFFLVGSAVYVGTAVAWLAATNYRFGLLMAGIATMYGSVAFPRPLSIRRAGVSGIGLLISGIGLVFF